MFTDIVGSTSLVEAMGDEAWQFLLEWHDRALRSSIEQYHGEEAGHEGDGFFVVFDDVVDAIDCGLDIQSALALHRRDHGFAPAVRIGVHLADATKNEGGYSGIGVHEAAASAPPRPWERYSSAVPALTASRIATPCASNAP